MGAPTTPFKPYAALHKTHNGPGDERPSSIQVRKAENAVGALKGKTVLITGCSSGIGVESARALYEAGATLYLTARDVPKLEIVIEDVVSNAEFNKEGPRPQAVKLQLDSLESVRQAAAYVKAKSKQLNIQINNAGVMACPKGQTQDGFETHIGTNHFAHFLLFAELKDLLIQSAKETDTPSRVINLSSAGHRRTGIIFDDINFEKRPEDYEPFLGYGQSKIANIYMANSVTRHYSPDIIGLSVHPGEIMTELVRHLDDKFMKSLEGKKSLFKNPSQGAATTVWAAVAKHFEDPQNGGRYLANVGEASHAEGNTGFGATAFAEHAYDEEAEEKLWLLSNEATGMNV